MFDDVRSLSDDNEQRKKKTTSNSKGWIKEAEGRGKHADTDLGGEAVLCAFVAGEAIGDEEFALPQQSYPFLGGVRYQIPRPDDLPITSHRQKMKAKFRERRCAAGCSNELGMGEKGAPRWPRPWRAWRSPSRGTRRWAPGAPWGWRLPCGGAPLASTEGS